MFGDNYCPALAAICKDGNNVALQHSVPCFYRYVLVFGYFLHLLGSIICHAYSYFNFGIVPSIRRDCTAKVFECLYLLDGFIVNVNVTCGAVGVIFVLPMTIYCVFFMLTDSPLCRLASTTVFNSYWS